MMRGKIIKKRTKHRETLLRNLRKGKARLEPRTGYEVIPFPLKFASSQLIHHLYADLVLMEHHGTLIIEASLYNNVKMYKHIQTLNYRTQKLVRIFLENKFKPPANCEVLVQKFANSELSEIRAWADPIKAYCQRYEALLQKLRAKKEEVSSHILESYIESNKKTEQTRQNLFKTYPCYELKSELRDGQIQLTEIKMNQKLLDEIGHSLDSFISYVFQEGMPKMVAFEETTGSALAKMRLENYLIDVKDGLQSAETDSYLVLRGGYVRKIKLRHHYHSNYENGVPGFSIFGTLVAKQKPVLNFPLSQGDVKINSEFIQFMAEKEKISNNFMSLYYGQKVDEKYINIDKVCTIKELKDQ